MQALKAAYHAMKEEVSNVLFAQKGNITSVNIGEEDPVELKGVTDAKTLAAKLATALKGALKPEEVFSGTFTIPVVIVDVASVKYNLNFK